MQFGIAVNNHLVMPISVLNGSYVGTPGSANLHVSPKPHLGHGAGLVSRMGTAVLVS